MPLNAYTTLLGSIVMLGAWIFIGRKLKDSPNGGSYQSKLLHKFFLFLGLFFFIIFLPNGLLANQPSLFPITMAWAYVVSHIFMYIAFLYILAMQFSMIPRLANKTKLAVVIGVIAIVAITIFNAKTMVWGTRPVFDTDSGVTLLNAHPVVGAFIGITSLLCCLPTAILLIVNGVRNADMRTRSLLLGIGLLILIVAGPLHDVARNPGTYVVADLVTIVSLFVLASGVAYRIDSKISVGNTAPAAV